MPNLPLECIAKVIEWVDNRQGLFNLLTVSRDVFLIAARCLYRDPLRSFTSKHDENISKLVLFLLSQSPASGNNIDVIRQSNGLHPSGTPPDPKPMLDYLSLVKVIDGRFQFFDTYTLKVAISYPNNDIYRDLTWAFVGHRLDEIEELLIDAEDQEQYLSNASKMAHLRKIWIHRSANTSYKEMYDFAEAMIKAIQLHHGPGQVKECHMLPDPIDWCSRASYDNSSDEIDLSCAWRVLSLLPPPRHYFTLPRPDGSTVSLNHTFDPYMASIKSFSSFSSKNPALIWKALMKIYPDHSHTQLLQRLRGLTYLDIHSEASKGNDENLLAWAACEAEHYHHQPGGHLMGPLVPVEELRVDYDDDPYGFITSPTRMATPKWKILQDGLLGFAGTLRWLEVIYPQSDDGVIDRLFTIPRPLPKFKTLNLLGLATDRSVWKQVPNIEVLSIDIGLPPSRDGTAVPIYAQDNHNTGTSPLAPISIDTTTITTSATVTRESAILSADGRAQRQLYEIWFQCPKLKTLLLSDGAFSLLDPKCLVHSPTLEVLAIFPSRKTRNNGYSHQAQRVSRMIHPTRLTWDWHMPLLHCLSLDGNLHEVGFSWAIVRSCPTLRQIKLHHTNANHRFPLHIKGILDAPLDRNNNQMLPFTHGNLLSITFWGQWDIKVDELACLLQVVSGLKKIELESRYFGDGFGAQQLVEITKTHPSLIYVKTKMVPTTDSPSDLGLSYIEYEHAQEVSSIVGFIDVEEYSKIPEKRPCIINDETEEAQVSPWSEV